MAFIHASLIKSNALVRNEDMTKILGICCLSLALPLIALPASAEENPAEAAIKTATDSFLATLDDTKKEKAVFAFNADERENWHYTPRDRKGLPLKEMTEAQKTAAMNILKAAMSEEGLLKAKQAIECEGVLAILENNPEKRDVEKYFFAIFGTPGAESGWGFRFEGHHLSINLTFVGDKGFSVTPSFFGTNPAEVREGPKKGLRPLASEEDMARDLANKLIAADKPGVVFSKEAIKEILTGEKRSFTQLEPVGVIASDMSDEHQKQLFELISLYTGKYRSELADSDMKKIKAAGMDKIRFGWAGSLKLGEAYYYRVQGPTFLMEAANTQNNANHMHAVWRDAENDFGRDILGGHHHD